MRNVLVTGGAGFIGSHLVRHLLQDERTNVVVLDNLTGGFAQNVPDGAKLVVGDICDHDLVHQLFAEHEFDAVYHMAAYAAEGLSHFIRRFNYQNNLIGSMNLINEAIRWESYFVFASSIAVYGHIAGISPDEKQPPNPIDPYGIAKYAVERDLAAARSEFGLSYTIFRPHNVYGEYQNIADPYRNVVGIFMRQIMEDKPMTIFGNGSQTRAFSYIRDIIPAIAAAPKTDFACGEVFNIGAETIFQVGQLAKKVALAMGAHCRIEHLPERNEVVHAESCHNKARKVFQLPDETPLEQGLDRMARWAVEYGPLRSPGMQVIELEPDHLPECWRRRI